MESKKENKSSLDDLLIELGVDLGDNGLDAVGTDNFSAFSAISEAFGGSFVLPVAPVPNAFNSDNQMPLSMTNSFDQPPPLNLNLPPPLLNSVRQLLKPMPPLENMPFEANSFNQPPPALAIPSPVDGGFGDSTFDAKIELDAYNGGGFGGPVSPGGFGNPVATEGFGGTAIKGFGVPIANEGFGLPVATQPNEVQLDVRWLAKELGKDVMKKSQEEGMNHGYEDMMNDSKFSMDMGARNSGFGCSNDDMAMMSKRTSRSRTSGGRGSSARRRGGGRRSESEWRPQEVQQLPKPRPLLEGVWTKPASLLPPWDLSGGVGAVAAQGLGGNLSPREIAKRRICQKCERCARYGHHADECYSTSHADTVRCYNCQNLGHLAARCPKTPAGPRNRERARPSVSAISGGTSTTDGSSRAVASDSNLHIGHHRTGKPMRAIVSKTTSVGLICKLMQDPHLRQEAMRRTPEAYEKMITIMVKHVQL